MSENQGNALRQDFALFIVCKNRALIMDISLRLSGTGDSQRDSRESFAIETPIFKARQANSHESLEVLIRANHATKAL